MDLSFAPDHPVIHNMERTGYPDGKEPRYPVCPVCRKRCDTIYKNQDYKTVGCDVCMTFADAWDIQKCFEDD